MTRDQERDRGWRDGSRHCDVILSMRLQLPLTRSLYSTLDARDCSGFVPPQCPVAARRRSFVLCSLLACRAGKIAKTQGRGAQSQGQIWLEIFMLLGLGLHVERRARARAMAFAVAGTLARAKASASVPMTREREVSAGE